MTHDVPAVLGKPSLNIYWENGIVYLNGFFETTLKIRGICTKQTNTLIYFLLFQNTSMSSMSLPSISEMFPIHLITIPPRRRLELMAGSNSKSRHTQHSANNDRNSGSLPHLYSFVSTSNHAVSSDDDELDGENERHDQTKKHVCPQCFKRFSRPSSLRIHGNTHSGLTPFSCPYPGCGRRFNVSSNMRRHYRKHKFQPPGNDLRKLRPSYPPWPPKY
ncbi:hypothetical protein DFH05DRAFT_1501445 [Lentinula detonsa]|uniref:C2H2-type domain-containing protein n=2 Tax=Lentinula detonsa TaxID=2804962 RepID=A0A9W8NX56_9AGAR|nr:hypothetical protein DFH05DRAFT_1501445 [Lentinula detonsa]